MNRRKKKVLLILSAVLSIFVVSMLALAAYFIYMLPPLFADDPHQSDEVMIARFQKHREEFEQLRAMALADDVMTRVDENWTDPPNLANDRVAEYRRLFKIAGIPRGISKYPGRVQIEFIASSQGWVASGSSKGYIYSGGKRPLGEFVVSLNDPTNFRELDRYFLRPIENDWYLFFKRS
jgi:hypothetical protein